VWVLRLAPAGHLWAWGGDFLNQGLPVTLRVRRMHASLYEKVWGLQEVGSRLDSDEGPALLGLDHHGGRGHAVSLGAPHKPNSRGSPRQASPDRVRRDSGAGQREVEP